MTQIIIYAIFCALTLAGFFLWEWNTRLRKRLIEQRSTNQFVMNGNRIYFHQIESYKETETQLREIIRFQEQAIRDFAPQHSDERPVVDFPIWKPAERPHAKIKEEMSNLLCELAKNRAAGTSTII